MMAYAVTTVSIAATAPLEWTALMEVSASPSSHISGRASLILWILSSAKFAPSVRTEVPTCIQWELILILEDWTVHTKASKHIWNYMVIPLQYGGLHAFLQRCSGDCRQRKSAGKHNISWHNYCNKHYHVQLQGWNHCFGTLLLLVQYSLYCCLV